MHLCCHCRECCSSWASENEFPWFNRYFTEMNSACKYYNIQFLKIQLSYQDSYLLSLQFWDCYVSGTWGIVLCRDPWTAVIPGVVRGEILPAWAYVLRASLKTQSPSDFWDFVSFMPLAQRQLGRWIYSMTLAPIMVRIVGCTGKLCGYLPGLLLNMLENGWKWRFQSA